MTPSPYEVAVAVSRAAQVDPTGRLALQLLRQYADEGVDLLRVTYAQALCLAQADRRICEATGRDDGAWLSVLGGEAAARAATAS